MISYIALSFFFFLFFPWLAGWFWCFEGFVGVFCFRSVCCFGVGNWPYGALSYDHRHAAPDTADALHFPEG